MLLFQNNLSDSTLEMVIIEKLMNLIFNFFL